MSIFRINYNFPKEELLELFYKRYPVMRDWEAPEYFQEINDVGDVIAGFKVDEEVHFDKRLNEIAQEFCNRYSITDKFVTQFISVEPNKILPWHEDGHPSSCCVNVLLSGDNAPVEFEDGEYTYNTALLNIRKKHRVVNGPNLRIMFRIVFWEELTTYESIEEKLS